ncbi:hypothetical protein KUTeg_005579 [Tegillarca granosa]|uniref:VWFA domain-containing protein n=1 Tax=Tegillarca granosa TaxID=220873 RepID=A0ABQ9FK71_TEGGR|nr:hypothetical protein KUTeg_005579 [Tegillarca granosa]
MHNYTTLAGDHLAKTDNESIVPENPNKMFRLLSVFVISISLEIVKSEECRSLVDIVCLVDTSDSFGPDNFKTAQALMETFVSGFTVGNHYAKIGIDTFDDTFKSEFQLKTYNKKSSIISAIRQMKYRGRGTDMVKALEEVRKTSFSSKAGNKVNIVLMFQKRCYKRRRVQPNIDDFATYPKRKFSFRAKTSGEAINLAQDLIKYTCKVSHGPFPEEYVGCFLKQKNYKYTKSRNLCHCKQTTQTGLRRQNKKCNIRCDGNKNVICGGRSTVAVYKTGTNIASK